jgi:large subunit ribosomal protein L9
MGYLQFGRHGIRQIIRFKDAVNDSVVVNPLLYPSQGLHYNRKLQVILTTVSILEFNKGLNSFI